MASLPCAADPVVKKKARGYYVGEAPSSSSGDRQLLRPKAAAIAAASREVPMFWSQQPFWHPEKTVAADLDVKLAASTVAADFGCEVGTRAF